MRYFLNFPIYKLKSGTCSICLEDCKFIKPQNKVQMQIFQRYLMSKIIGYDKTRAMYEEQPRIYQNVIEKTIYT
ncbi:hypothetical protein AYI70_g197 [Smittium culicis]|uniref:Uncharacterized protein n=1 Tax=Smittium culicis TaxID=133412 RepID=A0A1R1YHR5_9FUNG|nr:hypothetical protein AYI70_g197 [Smittium culicis]